MRELNEILCDATTKTNSGRLVIPDCRLRELPDDERERVEDISTPIGTLDRGEVCYLAVDDAVAESFELWLRSPNAPTD
jgi:hypothetical protein